MERGGLVDLRSPGPAELARWTPPLPDGHPRHARGRPEVAAVWTGVVWGRLGRADHAWAWWDSVTVPELAPWIAAERGRVLREFGLHEAAEQVESDGLATVQDPVDALMLRISLVADAVGVGDLATARRGLESATDLIEALPVDDRVRRQRLRRRWVEVEVQLAGGEQPRADGLPSRGASGPVYPVDHDAGTDFHRAKGLLFAGVVREDPGLLAAASELAPPALRWAVELARLDAGDEDARARALGAWAQVVPPPAWEDAVRTGATARRLRALGQG